MARHLHPEDARLWSLVTATVRPLSGRPSPLIAKPVPVAAPATVAIVAGKAAKSKVGQGVQAAVVAAPPVDRPKPPQVHPPHPIEPRRKHRIARAREPIGARLDLHGLDQDRARAAVHGFIQRAHADGVRAVLIITGKGAMGDGVLRRHTPDWLADPAIRPLIAGLSPAERHHGGEGALYVALKRRHR